MAAQVRRGQLSLVTGGDDGSLIMWEVLYDESSLVGPQIHFDHSSLYHSNLVTSVESHPSKALVVSSSFDSKVQIWDVYSGLQPHTTLGGHGGFVWSAKWGPEGSSLLASAAEDGTAKIWSENQQDPCVNFAIGAPVFDVEWLESSLVVAGDELGRLLWLDLRKVSEPLSQLDLHKDCVHVLALSPDGKFLASGSDDGKIGLVSIISKEKAWQGNSKEMLTIHSPRTYVRGLAWGHCGRLFSGGWDCNLCRTNVESHKSNQ